MAEHPPGSGRPVQLALDLTFRPAMGREDFLVGPSNEAAVQAIDRWPAWPSHLFVLVGPPGSGKSHLAEVWRRRSRAVWIETSSLNEGDVPELASRKAVIVENAPCAGMDERAVFHLINLLREQGGCLLITSRLYPTQWGVRLPDLLTRLKAAQLAELKAPDDALLRGMLVKLFSDRQITVDELLIGYMIRRMERSGEAARQLVAAIDARALSTKSSVTRRLVGRIMDELGAMERDEDD